MSTTKEVLQVNHLVTRFKGRKGKLTTAVNDVSFSLNDGEILAIVGESGSGKSVTSLSVMGLVADNAVVSGEILYRGENLAALSDKAMQAIRGDKISMIFQEPMTSLNPVQRIGTQLVETIRAHNDISKQEARTQAIQMLELVGIPSPERRIDDYPHNMSGGMRQRVMIAMALACHPDILIADEPTTALDVTIQAQILELLRHLQKKLNMSTLLITHDLGVVSETADRVIVMYCGRILEIAPVEALFKEPRHPYTIGLLNSIPRMDQNVDRLYMIDGMVPDPNRMPPGCPFSDRCPDVMDQCRVAVPALVEDGDGRAVRCFKHHNDIQEAINHA